MNIILTPPLEKLVNQQVESGGYHSAMEVIRDALLLFEERNFVKEKRLEKLRAEVKIGLEQADKKELVDGEMVFQNLRNKIEKQKQGT